MGFFMNKHPRVLIVDDHPISRRLPAGVLRQHGWEVDIAADGESALDKLAVAHFDAVLLDLSMPGLSGFEVCRRIREDHSLKHLRIIAYTALETLEQLLQTAGFDSLLRKPISPEKLMAALQGSAPRNGDA
jgi:CheY-like chemotaxis protein